MTAERYAVYGTRRVLLHDPEEEAITMREQAMGRLELRCSVCRAQTDAPWRLDDSGRCDECRP